MNYVQRLEHWGDMHHPKWIDIIRIALGGFLCYKGFDFLQNMSLLIAAMANRTPFGTFEVVMLGHYIAYAHMIGGLLLIAGIGTRVASLMQLPILIGAIIFINTSGGIFKPYSELILSVIILALLIYFLIAGNGPMSVKMREEKPGNGI